MDKYRVSLGAGHGGFDFGTIGPGGLAEKEVCRCVAGEIARRLDGTGAFAVTLVREDDRYVATPARAGLAYGAGSLCHVEIHFDLSPENTKSAAVWYSADIPADRVTAARLSRRLAAALGVPDCGARVRYDYCRLFERLAGFEDYYTLVETCAVSGIRHVFYCECGLRPAAVVQNQLAPLLKGVAEAVTRTVCELFGVRAPARWFAGAPPLPALPGKAGAVYLKDGFFNVRCGPGPGWAVTHILAGLIFTGFYGQKNGWIKISEGRSEFISAAAVDLYLEAGSAPCAAAGDAAAETTGGDGFHFVLSDAGAGGGILGAVGVGTAFYAAVRHGWRRVIYCDRVGFIGPSAFGGAPEPRGAQKKGRDTV